MKFHRVRGVLPSGVLPEIAITVSQSHRSRFFDDFFDLLAANPPTFAQKVEQLVSTIDPPRITLDVPESAAAETARVLRAMADELSPEKRS